MIELRNSINSKEIYGNENPKKVVNIVEKIFDFNKKQKEKGLKIFQQMLQRLPIDLAQAKAVNTSENLLDEIRQIIYSLYREKEITKKVYNNAINSIKFRMDTIFLNSENTKTSDLHRLLSNLSGKINLKEVINTLL